LGKKVAEIININLKENFLFLSFSIYKDFWKQCFMFIKIQNHLQTKLISHLQLMITSCLLFVKWCETKLKLILKISIIIVSVGGGGLMGG